MPKSCAAYAQDVLGSLLVGDSPPMAELREKVRQLAASAATVLVTGPTGSGKDNVARALHALSTRSHGPFEAVNCGAIPTHLAESEFFGAEAGAFTGASKLRRGRIEAASGGTLFLDEVGELPLEIQVKLLRVLESRQIERLGGRGAIPVDVRIVAATNRDLEAMVADGRFRADLYWRLAVVSIDVPPLVARMADLVPLVSHFARARGAELALSPCAVAALVAHDWPGNVRELRNFVDRALAFGDLAPDAAAVARLLSPARRSMDSWLQSTAPSAPAQLRSCDTDHLPLVPEEELRPLVLKALLAEAEAAIIRQALSASGGAVAKSARMLGLKRTTLVEKMKRMGLSRSAPAGT
ncbi:sigma-54 interaction domain-containing protein [Thermaurantiacus sp.]